MKTWVRTVLLGHHRRQVIRGRDLDADARIALLDLGQRQGVPHHPDQVHRPDPGGRLAGEVQKGSDDAVHAGEFVFHPGQEIDPLLLGEFAPQQVDEPEKGPQGIAQLMGQTGGQAADGVAIFSLRTRSAWALFELPDVLLQALLAGQEPDGHLVERLLQAAELHGLGIGAGLGLVPALGQVVDPVEHGAAGAGQSGARGYTRRKSR